MLNIHWSKIKQLTRMKKCGQKKGKTTEITTGKHNIWYMYTWLMQSSSQKPKKKKQKKYKKIHSHDNNYKTT